MIKHQLYSANLYSQFQKKYTAHVGELEEKHKRNVAELEEKNKKKLENA